MNVPPTVAISRLARSLNGVSSRRLRQEFPGLRQHYWRARRLRSGSHVADPAGRAPISVLRQCTEQQDPPHDGFLGQPPGQRAVPGRVEVDDVSQCIGNAGIDRRNTGFYDDARQKANAPTIFWTWGGGPLKQYIWAGTWSIA